MASNTTVNRSVDFGYGAQYWERPSAPAALVDGVLLASGIKMTELHTAESDPVKNAVMQRLRAEAVDWIKANLQTPEGVADVVATATKGYSNVNIADEMEELLGVSTDAERREIVKTDEGRAAVTALLGTYAQSAREVSQIFVSISGGETIFLNRERLRTANEKLALPYLVNAMSEEDMLRRVSSGAVFDAVGLTQNKARRVAEFYASEDYTPTPQGEAPHHSLSYAGSKQERLQQLVVDKVIMDELIDHLLDGAAQGKVIGDTSVPPRKYYTALDSKLMPVVQTMSEEELLGIANGTVQRQILPPQAELSAIAQAGVDDFMTTMKYEVERLSPEMNDQLLRRNLPPNLRDEGLLSARLAAARANPPARFKSLQELTAEERQQEYARLQYEISKNGDSFAALIKTKNGYINGTPATGSMSAKPPLAPDDPRFPACEARMQFVAREQRLALNRLANLRELDKPPLAAAPTQEQLKEGSARRLAEAQGRLAALAPDAPEREAHERYVRYLTEQNAKAREGALTPGDASTRAVFSPQLADAIRSDVATRRAIYRGGLDGLNTNAAPLVFYDHRELGKMSLIPNDTDPTMLYYMGVTERSDLEGTVPQQRKDTLDAFYDINDSFDPLKTDLSCLDGTDIGPRGEDGLTASERDFLKIVKLNSMNQNFNNFHTRDSAYIDQRYTDPAEKAKSIAKIQYITSLNAYLSNGLDTNNGFGNTFSNAAPIVEGGILQYPAMAVGLARQRYAAVLDSLEGRALSPVTLAFTKDQYDIVPGSDMQINSSVSSFVTEKRPLSEDAIAAADGVFSQAITVLYNQIESVDYMKEHNLKVLDMISLNGVPASTLAEQRYPDSAFAGIPANRIPNQREKLIQADILRAMATGEARVETALVTPDPTGRQGLKLIELRGDSKAFAEDLKKRDHGWFRRTFTDWGPFKITTDADRAEEVWQNDPDKATRQAATLRTLQEKAAAGAAQYQAEHAPVPTNAPQHTVEQDLEHSEQQELQQDTHEIEPSIEQQELQQSTLETEPSIEQQGLQQDTHEIEPSIEQQELQQDTHEIEQHETRTKDDSFIQELKKPKLPVTRPRSNTVGAPVVTTEKDGRGKSS